MTVRNKIRAGGLASFEQRVLDGDTRALRALVRQAMGPNTLDLQFNGQTELRSVPNGTGGDKLLFTGCASVVDAPYGMADWIGDYTEIVRSGAFTQTLNGKPDVVFCLNHGWDGAPMARTGSGTLRLSAATDFMVEADLDGTRADVHQVRSAMEAMDLDAMSFAFWVTRQTWSPDYDQRDILEVDLNGGDVSVVTWPANPATTGTTALRSRQARALMRTRVPALLAQRAREEQRAGKSLSASTMETLQEVLDLIAGADENLDASLPLLSELMGVPNPDCCGCCGTECCGCTDPACDGTCCDQCPGSDTTSSETNSEVKSGLSLGRLALLEDLAAHKA
jgi:HK97 family phage prohead protease